MDTSEWIDSYQARAAELGGRAATASRELAAAVLAARSGR